MAIYNERIYTSSDGLRLYARDYPGADGAARLPVICIHGLTRNSADFEEVAPWIAGQGRRVLAVDVRGRGHSQYDANPDHYNPLTYADDVAKLFHDLGIARAVFIGTSMGGIITMTMALKHPKLIAAAVLNDTGPTLSTKGLGRIAGYVGNVARVTSWTEAAEAVRAINESAFPGNTAEDWMKWARRGFEETGPGQLAMRYDPNIALPIKTGKLKPTSLIARHAFKKLARKRPTLLLRGTLSDLIEPEQSDWMRAAAPEMQYAEVPNVGHAPMLNEPAALDALRNFLAHVD
ncbi:MAG: alpha/beta fold hydrolase [Telluria sp.]